MKGAEAEGRGSPLTQRGAAATLGELMCTSGVVSTQQPASCSSFSNAYNVDLPPPCQQTALAKWHRAVRHVHQPGGGREGRRRHVRDTGSWLGVSKGRWWWWRGELVFGMLTDWELMSANAKRGATHAYVTCMNTCVGQGL